MPGFTAINAPAAGGQSYMDLASRRKPVPKPQDTVTVASEYLGRGGVHAEPPLANALHGRGSKKAAGKGKKRAITAAAATTSKRRKTSDVSEGLRVTKAATEQSKDLGHVANPLLYSEDAANTTSVPVYTSDTSMSSWQTVPQKTSVDAVKDAQGRGTTIYRHEQTSRLAPNGVSYAQPLLDHSNIDGHGGAPGGDRVLRPRKSAPSNGALASKKPQSFSQAKTAGRPAMRQSDEDFIGEDGIDDSDILALAGDAIKTSEALKVKPQKASITSQLPTPTNSDDLPIPDAKTEPQITRETTPILTADENFLISDGEEQHDEIAEIVDNASDHALRKSLTPPARDRRLNTREVDKDEDYGGALLTEEELKVLARLRSSTALDGPRPIVRLPFPTSILDRSPVFGASSNTVLRTCFRVGEALKEGAQAVRENKKMILEIYARVTASACEGRKQHFTFQDLYHEKPPHLEGTFELWQQNRLWELDSKAFMVEKSGGRLCRAIAKMEREEKEWRLEVLSVWEATWEDVEYAAGIYAYKHVLPDFAR